MPRAAPMKSSAPAAQIPSASGNAAPRWVSLLLIAAVLITFGPVVTHGWGPIDDADTIWANARLNPPNFDSQGVGWYWRHEAMGLYAPLTYTVWGLLAKGTWVPTPDENGAHVDPRVFHAASVLVHAASVLLVYALLLRLLPVQSWPAAAAGALLFGLHPIQVEAVAWASGLKDLLSGMFALAALNLYVMSARHDSATVSSASAVAQRRACYWLGMGCVLAGMLCKPSAMVTPLLAALIDRMILRRSWRQVMASAGPWLLAAIPLAVVAKLVQPGEGIPTAPLFQRPVVAGASLAFYLWKLLVPARFAFDYGWRPPLMLAKPWFWGIALVPVALAAMLWAARRRWPWLAAAALVSITALLPVLGFTPFLYQYYSTVADHYPYVAMLGPAMVAAWGLGRITLRGARVAAIVTAAVLLSLSALSIHELGYWRTEEASLRRTLEINPDSLLGHNGLGRLYRRRGDGRAEEELRRALAINPDYLAAWANLSQWYQSQGRVDDAVGAVRSLEAIHRRLPQRYRGDPAATLLTFGVRSITQGRFAQGARYLQEYLKSHPDDEQARLLLEKALTASAKVATRPVPTTTTTTRGSQ